MKPYLCSLLVFACLAGILSLAACKKDKLSDGSTSTTLDSTTLEYQIYCDKDLFFTGDTIQFSTNIPQGVKKLWKFGDGTTSTEASPTHTFSQVNDYHYLTIIVDGDTANKNKRNPYRYIRVRSHVNFTHIAAIQGLRWWEVTRDSCKYPSYEPEIFKSYNDTFSINVLNDTTLLVKNDTLTLASDDMFYGITNVYTFYALPTQYGYKTFKYYFSEDRIVYKDHPDKGGVPEQGKRPKFYSGTTTTYQSHK